MVTSAEEKLNWKQWDEGTREQKGTWWAGETWWEHGGTNKSMMKSLRAEKKIRTHTNKQTEKSYETWRSVYLELTWRALHCRYAKPWLVNLLTSVKGKWGKGTGALVFWLMIKDALQAKVSQHCVLFFPGNCRKTVAFLKWTLVVHPSKVRFRKRRIFLVLVFI